MVTPHNNRPVPRAPRTAVSQIIESLWHDIKLAPRLLWRSPVLAATILLTLTLGIGVNSGVFTLIHGILYRPRVATAPESFVRVNTIHTDSLGHEDISGLASFEEFAAYQHQATLETVTAWSPAHMTVGRTDAVQILGMLVSCDFFKVYGPVKTVLGRVFKDDECTAPGSAPVVLIGEALWRAKYRADSSMIGQTLTINSVSFTVIGILPDDFSGRTRGPGLWVPITMQRSFLDGVDLFRADSPAWLNVEGRLARNSSRARAQAALQVVAARLQSSAGNDRPRRTRVEVTGGAMIDEPQVETAAFWITPLIMSALGLILLLVCANVTMLLLARAVRRRPEMAIRIALGASRGRLFQMMLTESVALSLVAGAAGVWLAYAVSAGIAHALFTAETPVYQISPQASTLTYLAGVSLLAGMLAGWAPAGESLRQNVAESIRSAGIIGFRGNKRWGLRDTLVLLQVAVGAVLIVGAGLFIQTERSLASANPGFDADHIMLTTLDTPANGDVIARDAMLRAKLSEQPQIKSVAFANSLSIADESAASARVRTSNIAGAPMHEASISAVSPEYFTTMGIRLISGNTFSVNGAVNEVILSVALANSLWPNQNVVGRQLILENGSVALIVGVAGDTKSGATTDEVAQLYVRRGDATPARALLIRFDGDAATARERVRAVVRESDATAFPVTRTVRSILVERAERFLRLMRLVLLLALLAIVLSAIGVYGVVSFAVNQQAKALGIRMALGASRAAIIRQVVLASGKPALLGLGVGIGAASIGALALERVFAKTPVPIRADDPLVYGSAVVFVVLVVLSAMAIPVRRAIRLNVNDVLRD